MEDLRYPIGTYEPVFELISEERRELIREAETQPTSLRTAVESLTLEQLDTPYRPGGWTILQVVHHLADNNMNAYIRFKRGLTESTPNSPQYREDLWAELPDYREMPVGLSVSLLDVLHKRFAFLLRTLEPEQFLRTVTHSTMGLISLDAALHRFVWHNRHHMAQITGLFQRMGW